PRLEALEDRLTPTTYHINSLFDDGSAGTLRWAINQANADPDPDTIDFRVTGTIRLGGAALPAITGDVTITGPGAANLTVAAHGASRVLVVNGGATLRVSGLTLANGAAAAGGVVFNAGSLTLDADTLTGATANGSPGTLSTPGTGGKGGALFNAGTAT